MFLGVSGSVLGVDIQQELTDEEREIVAERLLAEQRERFDGVRKAAYTAAGVNPATWARVTSGQRVRPDRLVVIVKSLWPESRGDWGRIPATESSWTAPDYRGPTWVADADDPWVPGDVALKDYIDSSMAETDGRIEELEERVRELERMVLDVVDPEEGGGDLGGQRDAPATSATDDVPLEVNDPSGDDSAPSLQEDQAK